jgi:PhzF family phenazine biosynthesis protein
MSVPIHTVDAFTRVPYTGNPAGVCPLEEETGEWWMQRVARELNLSETAFVWPIDEGYRIRWFTPTREVDLCGHATLATAHMLWETGRVDADELCFASNSGELACTREEDDWIGMDFPAEPPKATDAPKGLEEALGAEATWVGDTGRDLLVRVADEATVRQLEPNLDRVEAFDVRGMIVTARSGDESSVDFVSRFFAPAYGVPEDPVTGSAHCALGPYWTGELGDGELVGRQVSQRGGTVRVRDRGERVQLLGHAVTVLEAKFTESAAP